MTTWLLEKAILHVFEEGAEVFAQGMNDIEEDRQGRYGAVVLDLGDESFTDARLAGQLFQGDILLRPFDLILSPISNRSSSFI
jgi:hypothetical protein